MSILEEAAQAVRDAESKVIATGAEYDKALEDLDAAKRTLIAICTGNVPLTSSPQDTDSTETVEGNQKMSAEQLEEFEREVNEASLAYEAAQNETVQPMADLSGIDHSPAFEGYQPNGSLPEAD